MSVSTNVVSTSDNSVIADLFKTGLNKPKTKPTNTTTRIKSNSTALKQIRNGIINRPINFQSLNELFETSMFDHLNDETVMSHTFKKVSNGSYDIRFSADLIDHQSSLFKTEAFHHWINSTINLTLVFAGPPAVMYNHTNNCLNVVHNIEESEIRCETGDASDDDFNVWVEAGDGNPFVDPLSTKHVESPPNLVFYCFGRKVIIDESQIDSHCQTPRIGQLTTKNSSLISMSNFIMIMR